MIKTFVEVVSIDGVLTRNVDIRSNRITFSDEEAESLQYETFKTVKKIERMLNGIEHIVSVLRHPYGGPNEMGIRIWIPQQQEHVYMCLYK